MVNGNALLVDSDPTKCRNLRLFSHGSHYDPPILSAAIKAVGFPEMWFYRAPRGTRSFFDMAGYINRTALIERFSNPEAWSDSYPQKFIKHHALHDSIGQGFAVSHSIEKVLSHSITTM